VAPIVGNVDILHSRKREHLLQGVMVDNSLVLLVTGIAIGAVIALLSVAMIAPRYTRNARKDAVQQSRAVTRGQMYEQLVPYLPDFPFNPKDAQFLGRPVDFVVFDGLDEGDLRRIVFVEVWTRVRLPTMTGRIVYPLCDAFYVMWPDLLDEYGSKARFEGGLL
jgi:hypothetical protein